ncbi:SpoVR family protein [Bacillaceae bacterium W0354]
MSLTEKHLNDLLNVAKYYSLNIESFEIKYANQQKMNQLLETGYDALIFNSSHHPTYYSPEVFIVGNPHTIYLNKNNSDEMNLFAIAHCLGHIDFVNSHPMFERVKVELRMIKNHLLPFIDDMIQTVGKSEVQTFIEKLRNIYHLTWSPIYSYVYQKEKTFHVTSQVFEDHQRYSLDLYDKVIERSRTFQSWQKRLANLMKHESLYFYALKKLKIMNEGWASYWQMKLLEGLPLDKQTKMELALCEAALHAKEKEGINVYSLGRALWEQVPNDKLFSLRCSEIDASFIEHFYNKQVHDEEEISFLQINDDGEKIYSSNFDEVKRELIHTKLYSEPVLFIDQDITTSTGYFTINYLTKPYQVSASYIQKINDLIGQLLGGKVFIKPLLIE